LKIFFLRTLGIQSPVLIALVFIALTFLPFAMDWRRDLRLERARKRHDQVWRDVEYPKAFPVA
jgi:hypothetical protein